MDDNKTITSLLTNSIMSIGKHMFPLTGILYDIIQGTRNDLNFEKIQKEIQRIEVELQRLNQVVTSKDEEMSNIEEYLRTVGGVHRTIETEVSAEILAIKISAKNGDVGSQFQLGLLYSSDRGVPGNYRKAVHWFKQAALQGDADSQNNLGVMYDNGMGTPKDSNLASYWYRRAADQEHPNGQGNLGAWYAVHEYYTNAKYWLQKSAENGFAPAQFNLALLHKDGHGVLADTEKAIYWLRRAATQKHINSYYFLGELYFRRKSYKDAAYWLRKAAHHENLNAQYILAMLYIRGSGVPENKDTALYWLQKAANQGHQPAKSTLINSGFRVS